MSDTLKHFKVQSGDEKAIQKAFREWRRLLKKLKSSTYVQLEVGNSCWVTCEQKILPNFKTMIQETFDVEVYPLKDARSINHWAYKRTNGLVKTIVESLHRRDILVIANVLYFKGTWKYKFDKRQTQEQKFFLDKEQQHYRLCQMMKIESGEFRYLESDKFQALELPYFDSDLAAVIILPKVESLHKVLQELSFEEWKALTEKLSLANGSIYLPKFRIESEIELRNVLSDMGMQSAFQSNQGFTRVWSDPDVYISSVLHKLVIDVNEEGTDAVGTTATKVAFYSMANDNFKMVCNRPFLFFIRDRATNTILFIGQLNEIPHSEPIKNTEQEKVTLQQNTKIFENKATANNTQQLLDLEFQSSHTTVAKMPPQDDNCLLDLGIPTTSKTNSTILSNTVTNLSPQNVAPIFDKPNPTVSNEDIYNW